MVIAKHMPLDTWKIIWTVVCQLHIFIAGEESTECNDVGPSGDCTWEESEQLWAMGSRLCSIKRMR